MKNFKFKLTKSSKNQGFITLEILVAILIASGFLAVAMQSLVYAMAIKVQAQEKQRSTQLITEDLETANELANRSNLAGTCDAAGYGAGYGAGLWAALIADTPTRTKSLLSDGGGKQLALERIHVSNTSSDAPHRSLKIKYQVWDWDGTNFLDRSGATKDNADEPIIETYVEIIPDAALACP